MRAVFGLGCLLLAASAAQAQDAPICTDRPGKANGTCTVPVGTWQLESSIADWSRLDEDGSRTESLLIGSTFAKLGLSGRSDLQIGITPFARVSADGHHTSGFGDIVVRYKQRLTSDAAPVQIAAIPFAKVPTADHYIGNGKVEAGLSVPIGFALGALGVTVNPEVDWIADGDGRGRHPAMIQVVALSAPVAPRLTLIGDLWANWNYDPDGTVRQASVDTSMAYLVSNGLQLDAGINAGLTAETPDIELYAGFSFRL